MEFQELFKSANYTMEKNYERDDGIIDLPFTGKGRFQELGAWKIFFDAESMQMFVFSTETEDWLFPN